MIVGAHAQPADKDDARQSVAFTLETQEFSDGRGSLRSALMEYKLVKGATTLLLSPVFGERRTPADSATSFGSGISVYQAWSRQVSTRTHLFFAEDTGVYAHIDVAQDVTLRIAPRTTLTAGARWAEYADGAAATFLSLGARRYFTGGSAAYRLTMVRPEGQDAFASHLVNLRIKDKRGRGRTQLWASAGAASLSRAQFDANFSGADYAVQLQRTQPITDMLALVGTAGYSSYDDPAGRYDGVGLGLGLIVDLEAPSP